MLQRDGDPTVTHVQTQQDEDVGEEGGVALPTPPFRGRPFQGTAAAPRPAPSPLLPPQPGRVRARVFLPADPRDD